MAAAVDMYRQPDRCLTVSYTAGVNFIGHFHLVQLLLPMLQRQQGALRIVAVTCKGELDPGANTTPHVPQWL